MRMPINSGFRVRPIFAVLGLSAVFSVTAGCGDDGSGVTGLDIADLVGTYSLTKLSFDPQGSLPEADVLAALGTVPELIVTANNQAQIVYRDPISGLFKTVSASTKARTTTLRLSFGGSSGYSDLLLPRTLELSFSEASGVLSFDDESPDGARREQLVRLIPAWETEQLLDPAPGRLRVTFQRK